jgi:hypothetical protein
MVESMQILYAVSAETIAGRVEEFDEICRIVTSWSFGAEERPDDLPDARGSAEVNGKRLSWNSLEVVSFES